MSGWRRDIAILIFLQVVLGLIYLGSIPRIHIDEAWDSALGYNLAFKGSLSHPFIEGFGGMDVHFVQNRVVLPFFCAAIFKVAGYSILTSRMGSLMFGLLAVFSLYAVMRRWFGEKQAFWICLATIIHPWFFEVSRRARPEIYYTALALAFLLLLILFFESGSRRTAFLAGVLAGLSALTHPNGLVIVFSVSFAVVLWSKIRSIGRLIQWSSVGFLLVILPYIVYVLLAIQDSQVSFYEQMAPTILQKSFLHSEIIRWRFFLQWPKGAPLAIVMLTSWVLVWHRSSTTDKTIATIIALFIFILPFTSVNATGRYLVAIVPFSSTLIVRLIWRIIKGNDVILQKYHKTRLAISMCTTVVYLSTCIFAIGLLFHRFLGADFDKVINQVASVVEPNSRVYGDPVLWFGHERYQYGPWLYIPENETITLRAAINWAAKHRFDYAVRTAWKATIPMGIQLPPRSMPDLKDGFLGDYICRIFGTKVEEFYDPYYGAMEIYKLDWNKPF